MTHLIDTNILLRSCEPDHSLFKSARDVIKLLVGQGHHLYVAPQNLIEFWCVCTRPKDKNGLGYSTDQTQREVQKIKVMFSLLSDNELIIMNGKG